MILRGVERIQPKPLHNRPISFWAIGHRGFPAVAPENTIASFEAAVKAGVDMVEFDVALTKDGIPVVIHDKTLNRTTNGRGLIRKRKWKEISSLDAGSWYSKEFSAQKVPTLDEVLDYLQGKLAMNIEIKMEAVRLNIKNGVEEKIVKAVEKRGMGPHVVVSSFLPMAIRRIKKINPNLSTALLLSRPLRKDPRRVADRLRADAIHLPKEGLTFETVTRAKANGIPIRVYTVNDIQMMKTFLSWGVDGIYSDHADYFFKLTSGKGAPGLAM